MTGDTRTTVTSNGVATVLQRPALLLMKLRVLASEGTLELGLGKLKEQCEATTRWLTRLGAARVTTGEPHFADQADLDPVSKMRAITGRASRKRPAADVPGGTNRGVRAVLTAVWEVASMTTEEVLVLVDRLRFEAAGDGTASDAPEEPPSWTPPEEQIREMMAQLHQPPADDPAPVFLFVSRPGAAQLESATAEAFSRAREGAEQLARAAGMRLGKLSAVHGGGATLDAARLMDRQRCAALLAGCTYYPRDDEIVSDDPRSVEFKVSVLASYHLE